MRILIISYRDLRHPEMGGAEVILYEVYRRLQERGHSITFLTGAWPGGPLTDEIDGMRVIRAGNLYNFNWIVPHVWKRIRGEGYDVIVEDLNKIPFYGPAFQKEVPVLANVPHLFGTTVFQETPWPFALYVYLHEQLIPSVYRNSRFQVLSDTTRDDLIRRGVRPDLIHVIRSGIDHSFYQPIDRNGTAPPPVLLYLGRLKKYKGIDLPIDAMPAILERIPDARYWIAGDGDFREALQEKIREAGLEGKVELLGHKSGAEKLAMLGRTRVLVYTSPKEGWGLSVIEANAMGIPAVASDSPGLCESVRDGHTGYLVPHGDVGTLAARLIELLSDDRLWSRMGQAGIEWASRFHWDAMTDETERLLERVAREGPRGESKR